MTNRHHLFWPRKSYQTGLERRFRGLPCNIVRLTVETHRLIHSLQQPPRKPSHEDMKAAIQRHKQKECGCYGDAR